MKLFAQKVTEKTKKRFRLISVPSVASCKVAGLVGYVFR
jgi:hypothetical protein